MQPNTYRRIYSVLAVLALAAVIAIEPNWAFAWQDNYYNSYGQPRGYGLAMALLRVLLIAGLGGLGFAIGWFLSPHALRFRRIVFLGLVAIALLIILFGGGMVSWGLAWIFGYVAFFAGLGYWAQGIVKKLAETPSTFGSAKWADAAHMQDHGLFDPKPQKVEKPDTPAPPGFPKSASPFAKTIMDRQPSAIPAFSMEELRSRAAVSGLEKPGGIRMGFAFDGEEEAPFYYRGDGHILTVAPSRAGKGTTSIIPNLLSYPGSMLVIDPKGENAMMTAKARAEMGQEVFILDPWGIAVTGDQVAARFNPLDWLKAGDPDISENAMLLADSLIKKGDHKESFWDEEAKGLVQGVNLHVATDPDEEGQRHLGRVRDLLLCDDDDLKALFQRMLSSPHHVVASTGARCLQKEEKLLANVLATAQAQTHFLDSPRIRESLSASDFDFADLKRKKMTIYLVLPGDRMETFSRWLRLMVQQAITVNARNIAEKPDQPILFLLDEMAALGHMSVIEQAYGLMAGYGMQLWGIVQDLSQLKGIYGDRWQSFIGNALAIQYFGSRDEFTAEYFSKMCGVTTVWNFQSAVATAFSRSWGGPGGGSTSRSETETDTRSATQRRLIFADELMRLPKDKQLVFIEKMNPIQARRKPWFKDPEFKDKGVNLHAK